MKRIALLGSTGSIGQNALSVIRHFPDKFSVVALSAHANISALLKQVEEFHPAYVCVSDAAAARILASKLKNYHTRLFVGERGLSALVEESRIDKVVLAISGSKALAPLLKAIESNKEIALANKEALVMAGPLLMKKAASKKVTIIPIDSEQSAIWQCVEGRGREQLEKIYLTASGGPFLTMPKKDLKKISIAKVLRHPRWKMGRKISVDSATLMNEGLELLEAMFLFGVSSKKIDILIHPEAIVHSMVEFVDGVVLAQLSATDMRIPIQYALSYPERLSNSLPRVDFHAVRELHFEEPDCVRFPCLELAYRASRALGTMPCVMNAANEVSVDAFLKRAIDFVSIPKIIEKVMNRHRCVSVPRLCDIQEADTWARREAYTILERQKTYS